MTDEQEVRRWAVELVLAGSTPVAMAAKTMEMTMLAAVYADFVLSGQTLDDGLDAAPGDDGIVNGHVGGVDGRAGPGRASAEDGEDVAQQAEGVGTVGPGERLVLSRGDVAHELQHEAVSCGGLVAGGHDDSVGCGNITVGEGGGAVMAPPPGAPRVTDARAQAVQPSRSTGTVVSLADQLGCTVGGIVRPAAGIEARAAPQDEAEPARPAGFLSMRHAAQRLHDHMARKVARLWPNNTPVVRTDVDGRFVRIAVEFFPPDQVA